MLVWSPFAGEGAIQRQKAEWRCPPRDAGIWSELNSVPFASCQAKFPTEREPARWLATAARTFALALGAYCCWCPRDQKMGLVQFKYLRRRSLIAAVDLAFLTWFSVLLQYGLDSNTRRRQ